MEPIKKLISVAKEEVGYIEKNSINNLYDKNLNIGFNNYTKYWQDIEPKYQGYSWCAVFVNWCFLKSFGKENTKKLEENIIVNVAKNEDSTKKNLEENAQVQAEMQQQMTYFN